jgi:hypothetical protein
MTFEQWWTDMALSRVKPKEADKILCELAWNTSAEAVKREVEVELRKMLEDIKKLEK